MYFGTNIIKKSFSNRKKNDCRKTKAQGGSFAAAFAVTIKIGDGNKWTWKIPKRELDYNGLIN